MEMNIPVLDRSNYLKGLFITAKLDKELSQKEKEILKKISDKLGKQTTPYYAAARLWVDAIIDPATTRQHIAEALIAADQQNDIPEFKTGVFQV